MAIKDGITESMKLRERWNNKTDEITGARDGIAVVTERNGGQWNNRSNRIIGVTEWNGGPWNNRSDGMTEAME